MSKSKKIKYNQNGFTIIEATITTAIVSIGLLGVFSLVTQNIVAQRSTKDQLVASMLAQEGIELVRNVRDTNWITTGSTWDAGIDQDGSYITDYINGISNGDGSDGDDNIIEHNGTRLYLTNGTNYYTHISAGNTPTKFYRLITADSGGDVNSTPDGINDYYKITSKVQWSDGGGVKNYIAETYLYDWR